MPVDFIKKPVDGLLPMINVGGHSPADVIAAIMRFAGMLKADELQVDVSRNDFDALNLTSGISLSFSTSYSPDAAILLKNSTPIARISGLPLTKLIVDRWQKRIDAAQAST